MWTRAGLALGSCSQAVRGLRGPIAPLWVPHLPAFPTLEELKSNSEEAELEIGRTWLCVHLPALSLPPSPADCAFGPHPVRPRPAQPEPRSWRAEQELVLFRVSLVGEGSNRTEHDSPAVRRTPTTHFSGGRHAPSRPPVCPGGPVPLRAARGGRSTSFQNRCEQVRVGRSHLPSVPSDRATASGQASGIGGAGGGGAGVARTSCLSTSQSPGLWSRPRCSCPERRQHMRLKEL